MDNIIFLSMSLDCPAEKAFGYFTNNQLLESWLTAKADVEAKKGGKYELYWEPDTPENNSTIGCKILAYERPHLINFEWKGPTQFRQIMNVSRPLTNVTVVFTPLGGQTKIALIHTGWGNTSEWDEARTFFLNAWQGALEKLTLQLNKLTKPTDL